MIAASTTVYVHSLFRERSDAFILILVVNRRRRPVIPAVGIGRALDVAQWCSSDSDSTWTLGLDSCRCCW